MFNTANQTPERTVSPEHALELACAELSQHGLIPEIRQFGDAVKTHHCLLKNADGTEVSVGNGKGLGAQSRASAVFEAMEHYFSAPKHLPEKLPKMAIRDISTQCRLSEERPFMLMENMEDEALPCRLYSELGGELSTLFYPVFLSVPEYADAPLASDKFNYRKVAKYSTNSGTAIGISRDEAILHALLEVIERDAISTFLLQTYVSARPQPVRLLSHDSLPENIRSLITEIEQQSSCTLTLLEITNDLDMPVYLACLDVSDRSIQPTGYGASLVKQYAIERACLEALQSFHLHNAAAEAEDKDVLSAYEKLPRFRNCIKGRFDFLKKSEIIEFSADNDKLHDIESQINKIVSRLNSRNYRAYFLEVWTAPSGISCVNVVIPGLEKFNIITSGNPVLPSKRGLRVLG